MSSSARCAARSGARCASKRPPPREPAILLGTLHALHAKVAAIAASLRAPPDLPDDAYVIKSVPGSAATPPRLIVAASNERGVLYGALALARKIDLGEPIATLDETQFPYAPVRMLDHWDNLDGTIERGYAGPSIFFEHDAVAADLTRVRDYARLMASVGVNACSINNVNANPRVITPDFLPQLARVAEAFRPWGVRLFVSIDFSSPKRIGGLDTFDPLDARVVAFWKKTVDDIYRAIPDFGGFVLKADSEGRQGPSAYGRTHADAANVIARPLAAHGGLIFYRGFIYDHHMDWRNLKNDRARAAYDNLHPLDGSFDDAAALQIKHGPIDFQVREPPSPIFGGLEKTNQVIELQITQEYTGQQRHLCFLVPMWKEVLDFDLQARGPGSATPVKELVAGKTFHRKVGGFVAVANVGRDRTWLGHDLAMANLYGFGRLAWDPNLSARAIAEEWTKLTFGRDPAVVETIVDLQLRSWPAYEDYTGSLGVGTLTDIIQVHYGPAPASSEENGWGQWHRADAHGVGMDRTVATGTGFIGQYRPGVAATFESLATCPEDLLLFMHHVPYTHRLRSGTTVIQHIYDRHFAGAAQAADFVRRWGTLAGRIDEPRFNEVLRRLTYQAGHAEEWRDAVDGYFFHKSGIPDEKGRVGVGRGPWSRRGREHAVAGLYARRCEPSGGGLGRQGDPLLARVDAQIHDAGVLRAFSLRGRRRLARHRRALLRSRRRRALPIARRRAGRRRMARVGRAALEQGRRSHVVAPRGERRGAPPRRRNNRRGEPRRGGSRRARLRRDPAQRRRA